MNFNVCDHYVAITAIMMQNSFLIPQNSLCSHTLLPSIPGNHSSVIRHTLQRHLISGILYVIF